MSKNGILKSLEVKGVKESTAIVIMAYPMRVLPQGEIISQTIVNEVPPVPESIQIGKHAHVAPWLNRIIEVYDWVLGTNIVEGVTFSTLVPTVTYLDNSVLRDWSGRGFPIAMLPIKITDSTVTIGEEFHLQYLFMMWLASRVEPTNVRRRLVEMLKDATPADLWILCHLLIPSPLIEQLSPTYAACFFALVTGLVVPRSEDPTLEQELWFKARNIGSKLFYNMATSVLLLCKDEGIPTKIYSNAYSVLFEPQIRDIYDKFVELEHVKALASVTLASEVSDDVVKAVRDFYTSVDSNMDLYVSPLGMSRIPTVFAIEGSYQRTLRTLIRKAYNVQTPIQPLVLDNIVETYGNRTNKVFSYYTDNQVQQFYLPFFYQDRAGYVADDIHAAVENSDMMFSFGSPGNMMNFIADSYQQDGLKWYVGNPDVCNNDNMLDVESGSLRGETRKEDSESILRSDPNLVYTNKLMGARRRCFRVSELVKAFREGPYGFEYLDPDWVVRPGEVVTSVINPVNGKPVERTFPIYAIVQLYSFLRKKVGELWVIANVDMHRAYTQLLEQVKIGIRLHSSYGMFLNEQITLVNQHPEWRNDLLIYFGWLFLFAMWIRFWKGPGTPYPSKWIEQGSETCEYRQRDQHINIELSVHGNLLETLERQQPELANYLKTLPFMHYDWSSGEISKPAEEISRRLLNAYTVEDIINLIQLDQFCMAQGTDILSGTAFIYLTEILMVPRDRLNDLLVQVMKLLYGYELSSITSRERVVMNSNLLDEDKQLALDVIEQHRSILNAVNLGPDSGFAQPPLDLSNITETKHLPQGFGELLAIE